MVGSKKRTGKTQNLISDKFEKIGSVKSKEKEQKEDLKLYKKFKSE